MILHPRTQQEYDDALRLLRVINDLRSRGPDYFPPVMGDSPWVRSIAPKDCYL